MRTPEEKIEQFIAAIEADAKQESDMILSEVKREIDSAVSAAEDEALNETFRYIKNQVARERTESGRRVSRRMMERKNAINARREEMASQVMADVRARLAAYTETEEYRERLTKSARAAIDALGRKETDLYLRPADMPLADGIIKAIHSGSLDGMPDARISVKQGNIELGGLMAVCPVTHMQADETYDTKFEELRGHFAELFGLHLSR